MTPGISLVTPSQRPDGAYPPISDKEGGLTGQHDSNEPAAMRAGGHLWLTVTLLMLCYVVAQADKLILSLLLMPIQASLNISDTQAGLLQGVAFALVYAIAGIPVARFVDRGNRIHIAAICALAWSLTTIASGLAGSFAMLAALRAGTAIAEAGLPPAAFSIFSDRDDPRLTARATAAFMLAPFLGGGLAMIAGGVIVHLLPQWPLVASLGWDEPWRLILLLLGIPGIALALLLPLLVKDPGRRRGTATPERSGASLPIQQILRMLFVERPFFRMYHIALGSMVVCVYAYVAWFPSHLLRRFDVSLTMAGTAAGMTYLAAGVAGTVLTAWVAGRRSMATLDGLLRWFAGVILLLIPVAALAPLVSSFPLAVGLYGALAFLTAMVISIMVVPLQITLPLGIQGRASAIFTFLVTAVGGSVGPVMIGLLSDRAGFEIGYSLSIIGTTMALLALVCILRARRAARGWSGADGGNFGEKMPA